jgi:tetratricopeptide (TPR) repeat protein
VQLLFVAMPFGRKRDATGRLQIDFDAVYAQAIKPAAKAAGVEVIRADEERGGGIIHRPMYERLLLAEIVIADLTFANANVFYELGVRHAARPRSTILMYAAIATLPFDVAPIRSLPYKVDKEGRLRGKTALREALTERLRLAKESDEEDSPLFQLLPGYPGISLPHESTESFRDRARAASALTVAIREAAADEDLARLREIEGEIGDFASASRELPVDLLLAYRDVSAWDDMVRCVEAMPEETRRVVTVREQLALALNRRNGRGDREKARRLLHALLEEFGPSPETYGILGRSWKDAWQDAADEHVRAAALDQAIDAYGKGFEADPRDFYPGVNYATLLLHRGTDEDRRRLEEVLPVVRFAVARRGGLASPDYWDRATVLELAAIAGDEPTARRAQGSLLSESHPNWMLETTAANLRILLEPLRRSGRDTAWVAQVADALAQPSSVAPAPAL